MRCMPARSGYRRRDGQMRQRARAPRYPEQRGVRADACVLHKEIASACAPAHACTHARTRFCTLHVAWRAARTRAHTTLPSVAGCFFAARALPAARARVPALARVALWAGPRRRRPSLPSWFSRERGIFELTCTRLIPTLRACGCGCASVRKRERATESERVCMRARARVRASAGVRVNTGRGRAPHKLPTRAGPSVEVLSTPAGRLTEGPSLAPSRTCPASSPLAPPPSAHRVYPIASPQPGSLTPGLARSRAQAKDAMPLPPPQHTRRLARGARTHTYTLTPTPTLTLTRPPYLLLPSRAECPPLSSSS